MMLEPGARCGSAAWHSPEHGVDVGGEHPLQLGGGDVGDAALHHLVGRVVDEHVEAASSATVR